MDKARQNQAYQFHVCRSNTGRQKIQSLVAAQQPRIVLSSDEETSTGISSSVSDWMKLEKNLAASSDDLRFTTTTHCGRVAGSWKMRLFAKIVC